MSTEIHEPITIGIVFDRSHVRPVWFLWHNRRYTIREITQRWQTKTGSTTILHLGVSDGASCFELTFNQLTLAWQLASVETDVQIPDG